MTQAQMEELLAKVAKSLDPRLRARLGEAVLSESARGGLDPLFVLSLVAVESRVRVSVSSERGAYGLMQLKPSTFAWIAGREPDIGDDAAVSEDPVVDVRLAVRYFKWLEHRFHSRDDALMAYNAGPKRLQQYKKAGEIPDSLREYPRRVMKEYQLFVRLAGGPPDEARLLARAN
jgi:soluble lytic murein transglycosylase-like protein